ncbi:MAG: ABC transporter ATP-binding protein [Chloroflexi bacterium]|nr:ABC transporter ATP-binding protein [Chloroflexota bacterium]
MSDVAISLRNVTRRFHPKKRPPFVAVSDVTLDVPSGTFLSVVGPSGCGKSTLLGMISGLQPASAGDVYVQGTPVRDVRREIGFIFQRDALLPWKTVLDNVALALVFRGRAKPEARDVARSWITRVGLAGFEGYYPHQLSGGMRKRVSLAQTLVYDPPIVLMDEPFSALDVQTRNLMENELLQLWAVDRKTVVFITHDLEEAISLSDQVVVMTASPGRIKAVYPIELPRPRNVTEIRFEPAFGRIYERLWADLRDEVLTSYEQSKARAAG